MELEYRALVHAIVELTWLKSLAIELGLQLRFKPVIWCDNQGTTSFAANSIYHARIKDIKIDMHFVHDKVLQKELDILFIPSIDWVADFSTKPLSINQFFKLKAKLKVKNSFLFEGACEENIYHVSSSRSFYHVNPS